MAKMTKRNKTSIEDTMVANATPTIWKVGIYARLSVDSQDKKNESIDTQIEISKGYMEKFDNMILHDCYCDLGKTGTNFDREEFERLMMDIRQQKVNCVIVKDFSRLGRNYIETGNYIEKIFPFMQVRFIAVTDEYDSIQKTTDNKQMTMYLKNIVNELYAKDIAIKVKNCKKMKQEMGSYTGGAPPYGFYVKVVGKKRVLFPEDITGDIVRRIFDTFACGSTYAAIVLELYQKRIQPPKIYYRTQQIYCPEGETLSQWNVGTIRWLLGNPVYIGILIQSRLRGKEYEGHKLHVINEEDISVIENTHEPLIAKDTFFRVQSRLEKQRIYSNKKGFSKSIPVSENILRSVLYCGECGHMMTRTYIEKEFTSGDRIRNYVYYCPNHIRIDDLRCQCERISFNKVNGIILAVLEKEFGLSQMKAKDYCGVNETEAERRCSRLTTVQNEFEKRSEALTVRCSELYVKYRRGEMGQEQFCVTKRSLEEEKEGLDQQIVKLEEEKRQIKMMSQKINRFIRGLLKCKDTHSLDNELVQCLIKRINIYAGHKVEVIFNFKKNDLLAAGGDGDG